MSAFVTAETEFVDLECLVGALQDLGWTKDQIEVHTEPVPLIGYKGDRRAQKAHVVVRRAHLGSASNDLGFEYVDGRYVAHVSSYDREGTVARRCGLKTHAQWEGALRQAYAVRHVEAAARRHGWTVEKRRVGAKTRVELVRWR